MRILIDDIDRGIQLRTALAALGAKNVARQATRVDPHERVSPRVRVTKDEHAVDGHRRGEVRKRLLRLCGAKLFGYSLNLGKLGIAHAGKPFDIVALTAKIQRHRYRTKNAYRTAAPTGIWIKALAVLVDADQLATGNETLTDRGIEIGEHGRDYEAIERSCTPLTRGRLPPRITC